MHVCQQYDVDACRIDTSRSQVLVAFARGAGRVIAAAPGIDHRKPAGRVNEERVDGGAARGAKRFSQDLECVGVIDVAQHVERAVEESVTDCCDDDFADTTMIDGGSLLLRKASHRFTLLRIDAA